ncbi:hypothetical protein OG625_16375 [Streptomyces sp. NBC_01351]|uniref:hypothetical protein n=1 Tax=Streptomyces sp. NBC_01351 TaxID=2903833 RepID=UPI002E33ACA3|nr:hypothetical protein [Streptomyces sp. NBC_01351]
MTDSSNGNGLSGKRSWLCWVLGVPLGLVHLLNATLVYLIVSHGPAGVWDDSGYAGTTAGGIFAIMFSVGTILITLIPPVRRALGLWWFLPPVVLGVIAWVRIATLE